MAESNPEKFSALPKGKFHRQLRFGLRKEGDTKTEL
jgi:hypothetical protein